MALSHRALLALAAIPVGLVVLWGLFVGSPPATQSAMPQAGSPEAAPRPLESAATPSLANPRTADPVRDTSEEPALHGRVDCSLQLRVVDAANNRPIVAVVRRGTELAMTDTSGRLLLAAGDSHLKDDILVAADGYITHQQAFSPERQDSELLVRLERRCKIRVTVLDPFGAAIDAWLTVVSPQSPAPDSRWNSDNSTYFAPGGTTVLEMTPGSWIVATAAQGDLSGATSVTSACTDVILRLSTARDSVTIGVRDSRNAAPLPGVRCTLDLPHALPPMTWSGVTLPNGLIPLPVALGGGTFALAQGQGSIYFGGEPLPSLDLEDVIVDPDASISWIDVHPARGRWIRVVAADSGLPPSASYVLSTRSVEVSPGNYVNLQVGSSTLRDGLFDLGGANAESDLRHIIYTPGYTQITPHEVSAGVAEGAIKEVRVDPQRSGRVQIATSDQPLQQTGSSPSLPPHLWLFLKGHSEPLARLPIGLDGNVTGVPFLGAAMLLSARPAASGAFGELLPGDLYRDPPAVFYLRDGGNVLVQFDKSDAVPNPEICMRGKTGAIIRPSFSGDKAQFSSLAPGSYLIGTVAQVESSARLETWQDTSAKLVQVESGKSTHLVAGSDWYLPAESSFEVSVVADHADGLVVATFAQTRSEMLHSTQPLRYFDVDIDGSCQVDAGPDVRHIAVGTFRGEMGGFVGLAVFDITDRELFVRTAELRLKRQEPSSSSMILDLRLRDAEQALLLRFPAVLPPDSSWRTFKSMPLGTYEVNTIVGGRGQTSLHVNSSGVHSYEVTNDGAFVEVR